MSGLAKYLLQKGFEVSGSDINDSKYVQKVKKLGAKIYIGHDANNVPEDCIIIASTAIKEDNPEIIRAKELGLKIWHRSDLLAEMPKLSSLSLVSLSTLSKFGIIRLLPAFKSFDDTSPLLTTNNSLA